MCLIIKSIVFCAVLAGAFAGPAGTRGTSKCVSFCKDSTKFGYEPGISYEYDYSTDISTSVIGGSNHESRIHLTANVDVYAATPCELILTLRNVAIQESDPDNNSNRRTVEGSQQLVQDLQRRSLRFSFQDGKVEHVCAPEDEPAWVLNIKRGIISTLQNTMDGTKEQSTYEVDVSGRCLTRYNLLGDTWTGSNTVQKVKDLTGCSQRHSHISALQSIPYTSQSLMQSLPLLQGEQKCTQLVRDGKIEQVSCEETHRFQPFQQEESGAKTVVTQSLVFTQEQGKSALSVLEEDLRFKKMSLLFQNQGQAESSEADILNIVAILVKLEESRVPNVRAEAPEHFMDLVENLRLINVKAMQNLFKRTSSPIAKKFLLDAMPLVSSAPSLSLMRDLLLDGSLSEKQIDNWLSSLIFIKSPTLDMIEALQPLLSDQPRHQALLGVSALINSYCKENAECTDEATVQESLEKLFSYLGSSCRVSGNSEEIRKTLFVLKAIGNAGYLPTDADQINLKTLNRCFMDSRNPLEVRLAAIDAFRRVPCNMYDPQPILSIYSNVQNQDTELRIKAYLISMKCADRQRIDVVKDILYTDAVNQVSSFVWTHLTNLQETSSPDKQAIRELLTNEFLQNKFKTDARKYSRNYEGSYYNENWSAGASSDANLIFTPDSFLPRSAMVNLTVHLFGNSVNLLEVGGRVKALEQILEPIFGPNGYFPDKTVVEALHSMRAKRDVRNNEIDRLSTIYTQAGQQHHIPVGSFYTRIFGHEVLYKNFELGNENDTPSLVDENGKDWLDINALMSSLTRGNDIEYTKSTVLLDACYTVSTSAGIPLSLSVKSAATVGITANGRIDLQKFWQDHEVDVQGLLRPSAAIEIDGTLATQLGRASSPIKSGVRLQNTLHTSTAIEGKVVIKGPKLIQTSLSLPQDKQEIFTATSQLLILRPSGEPHMIEQGPAGIPKIAYQSCKGSRMLGVEFCTEVDRPEHGFFPISTPATIAVYVQKTDTFDSYDFDYEYNNDESETACRLTFDTPGSTYNRRLAANFKLDPLNGELDASVETPGKSFGIQGKYSASEKSLQLTVTSMNSSVLIVNTGLYHNGNRLEPTLYVQFYNQSLLELDGHIDLEDIDKAKGKATLDLSLRHLTETPIRLKGAITREGERFDTNIDVESFILTGGIRSQFRFRPGHVSSKTSADYNWKNTDTKTINISAKLQNTKKGSLSKFITQFNFALADSPDMTVDFMLDSQKSPGFFENTLKMSFGKITWDGHTLYNNQYSREIQDLKVQLALAAPRLGVDYNAEFTHLMNASGLTTKFEGRTRPENAVKAELEFLTEDTELMKKTLTAKAIWPENEYSLRAQLRELHEGNYEGELVILPQNSEEMKAAITYKNESSNTKLDHAIEFRARGFTSVPISGNAAFSASDNQSHLGGQIDINNKRWSTSLDYGVVKKNTHKLEGKLTLDETKYTGEINYRHAKNGDRILNVDLQGSKHFALEAKLNGDWPGPFITSLYIYPNKDTAPLEKFGIESTFDARAIAVKVNYYGEIVMVSASYGESQFQAECIYGQRQHYRLTVNTPELVVHKASVKIVLETPISGYQNIQLDLNHSFDRKVLSTTLQANLDQFQISALLSGFHTHQESRISSSLEMTGIDRLKLYGRLVRKSSEKSLDITYSKGEAETKLKAEFIRVDSGFTSKFHFKCCESMPEILIQLNHQLQPQLNSDLKIEWILPGSNSKEVLAELTGSMDEPFNVQFQVKTPWAPFEKFESGLALKRQGDERELELTFDGNFDILPLGLTLGCKGNRDNFKYEIVSTWTHQRRPRSIRLTAEGQYSTLINSALKASLFLPRQTYQINWNSEKYENSQKLELELGYNQNRYSHFLSWNYEPRTNHVTMTAWTENPNLPRLALEFERMNTETEYKLKIEAAKGTNKLLKTETTLKSEGLSQWDFSSVLESSLESVPTLKIGSKHLATDEILHKSEISVARTQYLRQLLVGPADGDSGNDVDIQTGVEFEFKSNGDIKGLLTWDDQNIQLTGDLQPSSTGKKIDLQLQSTLFTPVEAALEYKLLSHGYEVFLQSSTQGNNVFSVQVKGQRTDHELKGALEVDCSWGHRLKGSAKINTQENKVELKLVEDRARFIDLSFTAMAQAKQGEAKLDIQSQLFEDLHHMLHLSVDYSLDNDFKFSAKHSKHQFSNEIEADVSWRGPNKHIKVRTNGLFTSNFKIQSTGFEKLESSLTQYGDQVYEATLTHSQERTSEMTYHKFKLRARYEKTNPIEITTSVGLGNKKLEIKTRTPYEGWRELKLAGQLVWDETHKQLQIDVSKQSDNYTLDALAMLKRKDVKLSLQIQTPIEGYTEMGAKVEYVHKSFYEGKIKLALESQKIEARGKFAPLVLELELKTPFEEVKEASVSFNWNLSAANSNALLNAKWNEDEYKAQGAWSIQNRQGNATVLLQGLGLSHTFNFVYDFTQEYSANLLMDTSGHQTKIGGRVALQKQSIEIEAFTPFEGYESLRGQASYSRPATHHHSASANWDWNGAQGQTQVDVKLLRNKLEVEATTPIPDYERVSAQVEYQLEGPEKRLALSGQLGDSAPFKLTIGSKFNGQVLSLNHSALASVSIALELPLDELQKMSLNAEYKRQHNVHDLSATITKNEEVIQGKAKLKLPRSSRSFEVELAADFSAPVFGIDQAGARGKLVIAKEAVSTILAETNLNGEERKVEGSFQLTSTTLDIQATTSLDALKSLRITAQNDGRGKLQVTVNLNGEQSTLNCEYQFGGARNTKLNLDLTTPFEGFQSIQLSSDIQLQPGSTVTALHFQNERVRYVLNLNGTYTPTTAARRSNYYIPEEANFKLTLKSPVYTFEHIVTTLSYNLRSQPKIELIVERNTQEVINGLASWSTGEVQLNLVSKLPSAPINTRNSLTWTQTPFDISINIEAGPREYHGSLTANIQGFKFGEVLLQTNLDSWNGIGAAWNVEGDIFGGKALGRLNLGKLGEKSLKSSWKIDRYWQSAKLDLWFKGSATASEKGFSAQYASVGRKSSSGDGKITAVLAYSLGQSHHQKQLTFTSAIKRTSSSLTLDLALATPYELVRNATLHGKLISSEDTSLDLSISLNEQLQLLTHTVILVTPLASKLKFSFSCPPLGEPFALNAGYDLTTAQKTLELSFTQNEYRISVETIATVPRNSNEIELRMNVDSNVPLLQVSASGSMKAGYKIDSDGTRHLMVSVDSEQTGRWEVAAALRTLTDFHTKLRVVSPRQDIVPSLHIELNHRGSVRQGISSDVLFRIGGLPEVKGTFSASVDKVLITFSSGIRGFERMSLELKLESGDEDQEEGADQQKFQVDVQALGERVVLDGMLSIPQGSALRINGSLELKSSWNKIKNGSLRLQVEESGKVELLGVWGEQTLGVRGHLKGLNSRPWWKSIVSDLTLEVDSEELFKIKSNHYIGDYVYSFNVTVGEDLNVVTYLQTNPDKILSTSVQWAEGQVVTVYAEAGSGRFSLSVATPWTTPMNANGQYSISEKEQSAKGYFTYDGQRSAVEAQARNHNGLFDAFINVDIPSLFQKLDAEVKIRRISDKQIQGSLEMRMSDRSLAVQGEFTDKDIVSGGKNHSEKNLRLTMNLPSHSYPEVSADVKVQHPKRGFADLQIEASLTLPSGASKVAFGYEVPINSASQVGVRAMVDSRHISEHPIEIVISTGLESAQKFEIRLQYERNDMQLGWDTTLPVLSITAFADVPELLPTHSPLRFELSGSVDWPQNIQLKSKGSCRMYSYQVGSALLYTQNTSLSLTLSAEVPSLFEKEQGLSLKVQRRDGSGQYGAELSLFKGSKSVELIGETSFQPENLSASVRVLGALGSHFTQASAEKIGPNWEFELSGESTTLFRGKRVKISGQLLPKETGDGFDILIQCQTRGATHRGKLTLILNPWEGELSVNMETPRSRTPFFVTAVWKVQANALNASIQTNAGEQIHRAELRLNKENYEVYINLHCPLLPGKEFGVHTKAALNSNNHVDLLADLKWSGSQWRLEGTVRYVSVQDMEAKLELRTPFEDWDRITFAGKISPTELHAEIYTPFKNFPNAQFRISGLPLFEEWTSLNSFNGVKPVVVVGLPWVTYTVSGTLKLPRKGHQGEFGLGVEYGQTKKNKREKYDISLELPSLEDISWRMENPARVRFSLLAPKLGTLRWNLGGRVQWKTWAELNAYGEFNGEKVELVSEIRNESGNRRLSVILTTPFRNFDKYIASVRLENYEEIGTGRSILIEWQQPNWNESVRLEIDYRYRFQGFTAMDGEISVLAPRFSRVPPLSLRMQSNVKEGIYTGLVDGTFGARRPSLKVEAGLTQERIFGIVEGMTSPSDEYQAKVVFDVSRSSTNKVALLVEVQALREQVFQIQAALAQPTEAIDAELSMKTPFELFRSGAINVRLSPIRKEDFITVSRVLNNLDVSFGLHYNGKKFAQLELVSVRGRRSLSIYNPVQPVSLALAFERTHGQRLRILAEICTDLREAAKNTMGFEVAVSKTSSARNALFRVQAAEFGGVEIVLSHLLTSTRFDQGIKVRLFNPMSEDQVSALGYFLSLNDVSTSSTKKYDVTTRIDTPWRTVQADGNYQSNDKTVYRFLELKWDVTRDMSKRLGVKAVTERNSAWRSRTVKDTLTMIHPSIPNNVVIVFDRTHKNQELHAMEFTYQSTPFVEDRLTLSFSKENDEDGVSLGISHPVSLIDIQVQVKRTPVAAALAISYLDIHNEKQAAQLSWTQDEASSGNIFEVLAGNGLRSVFKVLLQDEEDKRVFSLRSLDLDVDLNVYRSKPYVDFGMKYESVKHLYFSAGLPHNKEISLRVWREEFGMHIQDVNLAVRLNTSQILSTKLNWRPELFDELDDALEFTVNVVKNTGSSSFALVQTKVAEELEGRWKSLNPSSQELLKSIATFSQTELRLLSDEYERVINLFVSMYEQNWFFVKNITGFVGPIFGDVFQAGVEIVQVVVETLKDLALGTVDMVWQVQELLLDYAGKLEETIVPLMDALEERCITLYRDILTAIAEYAESFEETYVVMMDVLEGRVEELEKKLLAISFVRTVVQYYKDYCTWIEELPMSDYLEDLTELLKEKIWRPMELYYKPYFDALNQALEEKNLVAIMEMPPFPYLRHVSVKFRAVCNRVLELVEAEQKIKELITKLIQSLDGLVRRNIPTSTLVWEVEKGQVEYHQPLTLVEWGDFNSLPQWRDSEQNAKDMSKMNDFYYELLDTFRNAKPAMDMDIRTILPPFGAHAVMAGDYHYFTFDKKYFKFAGECSYVLVADLLHQNFSLIVNYENRDGDIRKKSYSLVSGAHSIDIDPSSLKISVDGRKSELPLELGPTFIRMMPNGLEIFDNRGFQMTCSQNPAVCTVSVSGWYFGKVAGLLGTYDNEEMNDMRTPDGQIVTDVSNFAHSWRVGRNSGECRMKNFARDRTAQQAADVDGVCSEHFDDRRSLLRPCFGKVDTQLFKSMCLYDTSRNLNKASRQESACVAISAYVAECQKSGIDIWLPPTCVRCKLEDGTTLMSGENATLEIQGSVLPPQSTDVVILLEEASCLSDYDLTDAIRKLDVALQAEGLNENRYATVGFAGQGPHTKPHIRTSSGQIWAHSTLFRVGATAQMNGAGTGDLYEAIEFAARTLKFRAGVSKTFIAVTCGDEKCGSDSRYPDTLTLLIENDIKLHILTPKEFTTKGNKRDSTSSKVYGIDNEGVYTSGHLKMRTTLEPDRALKRHINLPKDLCTPLAVETNGTRFHLPRSSKKSLDIWTRRVAMTAQPSTCQHCECIPDKSGSPHVVCNRCISPLLEKMMLEWQKYQSVEGGLNEEIPIEMMDLEQY